MQNNCFGEMRRKIKLTLFSAFLIATPVSVNAATTVEPWQPIFEGIDYATSFTDEPVPQTVNSFRVDLFNPNIQFLSTSSNGDLPEETIARTHQSISR